jgi:hypothetical protein
MEDDRGLLYENARQQPANTQPAAAATAQAEQLFYK